VAADAGSNSAEAAAGPFNGFRGLPPEAAYAVGTLPTAVVAADFNGDGAPDLAVANLGSGTVSVLLNLGGPSKTPTTPPTAAPPTGAPTSPAPTGAPPPTSPQIPPVGFSPDIPTDVDPTSPGRVAPPTGSQPVDDGEPTASLTSSSGVAASIQLVGGGDAGTPESDPQVTGLGHVAAWSDPQAPAQSEFGPAFDVGPVNSAPPAVPAPAEKAQAPLRPGPRGAGAGAQDLSLQQGGPAVKASQLVGSTFDGDDSVTLFEAVARGWVTPARPLLSTARAGEEPPAPAEGLLAAAVPTPAPPDGPDPGARGAVPWTLLSRLPAFVGGAALAAVGLWFCLVRSRTPPVSGRRPDSA
jgi:hypothetical protein